LGALPVQGLDKDLHAFPETQRHVESALLLVDDGFVVFKWDNLAIKGGP
jgi:hypothetical protein